jgi:hypothetical protein
MTDKTLNIVTAEGDTLPKKLRDMGDGTWAEVVSGANYQADVTITRPSNTTDYDPGDVIGVADVSVAANAGSAIIEFPNMGPAGGHVVITDADLYAYITAIPTAMTSYRLELFNAAPTAILDNAAFDLVANDRSKHLGYIDLGSPADRGSTLYVQNSAVNRKVKLAAGSTSLYGLLIDNGGSTPASAQQFRVRLNGMGA